eukprot:14826909-Ditylum_brightwellii.AAC.1
MCINLTHPDRSGLNITQSTSRTAFCDDRTVIDFERCRSVHGQTSLTYYSFPRRHGARNRAIAKRLPHSTSPSSASRCIEPPEGTIQYIEYPPFGRYEYTFYVEYPPFGAYEYTFYATLPRR